MAAEKKIVLSSQLDVSVRNALVQYIQEHCVSDVGALKQYAKARYDVDIHDFAVVELLGLAEKAREHEMAEHKPPARSMARRR